MNSNEANANSATNQTGDTKTVIVEREVPHSPDKVWRALTQSPLIEEWLMKNDFNPVVGHRFTLRGDWGVVDAEVLAAEPNKALSYTWDALGLKSVVTWTLTPTGIGTHLRMEQSGFRQDQQQAYQGATYGWQKLFDNLERVVGEPIVSRAIATRYQPVLVALHWLLALMIVGLLCVGFFVLADMPNNDPKKLTVLMWHMAGGMFVLLLMVVRFIIRMASARPTNATTGSPRLDRLAAIAHYGLYAIVVLMIASGYATGIIAGLPGSVFARNGLPLPNTFDAFPTFQLHSALAALLVALIAVHICAALYHQFVLKDGLFRRIWFGKRTIVPAEK